MLKKHPMSKSGLGFCMHYRSTNSCPPPPPPISLSFLYSTALCSGDPEFGKGGCSLKISPLFMTETHFNGIIITLIKLRVTNGSPLP